MNNPESLGTHVYEEYQVLVGSGWEQGLVIILINQWFQYKM
ncbi:MAG TPA: hypothetical protein VFH42_00755 [Sporolactobacillaceae bacterium]|nr:hypothetical protein [Sporolactobacillaceae bacterium]